MIEVIACLALIPLLLLAFVSSQVTTDRVQSMTQTSTINQQIVNAIYQEAEVRPWPCLGFNPAVETNTDAASTRVLTTCAADPRLSPSGTVTRDGQTIAVATKIEWASPGLDSTSNPSSYGTKRVTVTLTYRAHKSKTEPVSVYSTSRDFAPEATKSVPTGNGSLPVPDPNIPQR